MPDNKANDVGEGVRAEQGAVHETVAQAFEVRVTTYADEHGLPSAMAETALLKDLAADYFKAAKELGLPDDKVFIEALSYVMREKAGPASPGREKAIEVKEVVELSFTEIQVGPEDIEKARLLFGEPERATIPTQIVTLCAQTMVFMQRQGEMLRKALEDSPGMPLKELMQTNPDVGRMMRAILVSRDQIVMYRGGERGHAERMREQDEVTKEAKASFLKRLFLKPLRFIKETVKDLAKEKGKELLKKVLEKGVKAAVQLGGQWALNATGIGAFVSMKDIIGLTEEKA